MTTLREKASICLLVVGVCFSIAAIVVATSGARAGKEIYYEYKGAERFDQGMGHAVPKEVVYWFAGGAVVMFVVAYSIREK